MRSLYLLDKKYRKKKPAPTEINEDEFKKAYANYAVAVGVDPNPDDPRHYYDYRALYRDTGGITPDESGHLPSKYKLDGHPRMVIDGVNTKTGKPATNPIVDALAKMSQGMALPIAVGGDAALDVAERAMPVTDWENQAQQEKADFMSFLRGIPAASKFLTAALQPTTRGKIEAVARSTTPQEAVDAANVANYPLKQIARPVEAIRAGIKANLGEKTTPEILGDTVRGFMRPEEVGTLLSEVPFQEWEQGEWWRVVPRAVGESVENFLMYGAVYGAKPSVKQDKSVAVNEILDSGVKRMMKSEVGQQLINAGYTPEIIKDQLMKMRSPVNNKTLLQTLEDTIELAYTGGLPQKYTTRMIDSIKGMKQTTFSASQLMGQLRNMGVKPEELAYSGIEDYLAGKDKVSKAEVEQYLRENMPEIEEVRLSDRPSNDAPYGNYNEYVQSLKDKYDPSGRFNIGDLIQMGKVSAEEIDTLNQLRTNVDSERGGRPKFSQYQLPGGENYREMLFTLPTSLRRSKPMSFEEYAKHHYGELNRFNSERARQSYDNAVTTNSDELYPISDDPVFKSSHFDEPNILFHTRVNDRVVDGDKTLFVEEVQSDWHQEGRKKGYKGVFPTEVLDAAVRGGMTVEQAKADIEHLMANPMDTAERPTADQWERLHFATQKSGIDLNNVFHDRRESGVPSAPLKKTWHELAMRRMLKEAVDKGYDRLAWTSGQIQADRYDLSKQIDKLEWDKFGSDKYSIQAYKGRQSVVAKNDLTAAQLEEYVGKDIANKIVSSSEGAGELSGLDLRVGGEGMKGFYDRILPQYMNKFLKRYGAKVEVSAVDTGVKSAEQWAVVDATDDGGQQVLEQFGSKEEADAALDNYDGGVMVKRLSANGEKVWSVKITPQLRQKLQGRAVEIFEPGGEYVRDEQLTFDGLDEPTKELYTRAEEERAYGSRQAKEKAVQETIDILRGYSRDISPGKESQIIRTLRDKGFVDFRGVTVTGQQDIAEIAAIFRGPIEHFQAIYTKGDMIVGHRVLTSGSTWFVGVDQNLLESIKATSDRLGADGIWIAHNHPSGDPKPSGSTDDLNRGGDIPSTLTASYFLEGKLKGHIVTNGERYTVMTRGDEGTGPWRSIKTTEAYWSTPKESYAREKLHPPVKNARQISGLARQSKIMPGMAKVIILDRKNNVIGIEPTKITKDVDARIRGMVRSAGGSSFAFVALRNDIQMMRRERIAVPEDLLDIIDIDSGQSWRGDVRLRNAPKVYKDVLRHDVPYLKTIQDDAASYSPADYTPQDLEMVYRQLDRIDASKYLSVEKKMDLADGIMRRLAGERVPEGGSELEALEAKLKAYREWKRDVYENLDLAIRQAGGVKPFRTGADFLEYRDIPKRYRKRGDRAKDPDMMREALEEMGYNVPDVATLYNLLDDLGREKPWKTPEWVAGAKQRIEDLRAKHAERRRMESLGVLPKSQAKKTIREMTGQIKVKTAIEATEEDLYKQILKEREKAAAEAARASKIDVTASLKAEYRLRDEVRREVQRVKTEVNKMLAYIKGVDTSKFSPIHKESIESIRRVLDFSTPTMQTMLRLEATREYLRNNPDAEVPDYVMKQLERLDKISRDQLSYDELEALYMAVRHAVHLETTKKTLRAKQQARAFKQVRADSINEMKPLPEIAKDALIESLPDDKAGRKNLARNFGRLFTVNQDHYDLMVETFFGGEQSVTFDVLFNQVKEGIVNQMAMRHRLYDMFQERLDQLDLVIDDIGKWRKEKIRTGRFNLTRGERMSIYLHAKNDNNLRHLVDGGFVFRTSPQQIHMMTEEDLDLILKDMSPEEVAVAEINADLSEYIYQQLNDVFLRKNGYELAQEPDYYGIKVARVGMKAEQEEGSIMDELRRQHVRIGLAKGYLNKRRQSKLPLELWDFFDQLTDHIHHAAAYVGLELPLSNASKLLTDPEWKSQFIQRYSLEDWKLLHQALRDIAGDWDAQTEVETFFNDLKNKYTTSVYSLNPGIVVKQALSFPLFAVYIPPEYVSRGAMEYFANSKAISERHKTFSTEFRQRVEFGFQRDIADIYRNKRSAKLAGDKQDLTEKFMAGIQWMDAHTVSAGMHGAVLYKLDQLKDSGLTPVERLKEAYKFADYVVNRTQPTFAPEHRSQLSKNRDFVSRMVTFATAATEQQLNLLRRTWRQYRRTGSKEDKDMFMRALMYVMVVVPIGVMAVDEITDFLYRKRNYEFSVGGMLSKIPGSWAANVAILRDLYRSVQSKIERGDWMGYDVEFPVMSFVNLVLDAGSNMAGSIGELGQGNSKKAKDRFFRGLDQGVEVFLMSRGLPYRTPKKIIDRLSGGRLTGGNKKKSGGSLKSGYLLKGKSKSMKSSYLLRR